MSRLDNWQRLDPEIIKTKVNAVAGRFERKTFSFKCNVACLPRPISRLPIFHCNRGSKDMIRENLLPQVKKSANLRLSNVSIYTAEVLEIQADDPKLHVLFVPGNPGVITFYKEFVESLYEHLGGNASISAVGSAAHTKKNFHGGRLFSLDEQVDHKMEFIGQELHNTKVPIVLVGHSIGAYVAIEMLKRSSEKVIYYIGLYPFLALIHPSVMQSIIGIVAASSVASAAVSFAIASLGILPSTVLRFFVCKSLGRLWSATAVNAACTHLSQYHVMRNVLFMTNTEFKQLRKPPGWAYMRENQEKIAFLFGIDDHWGPQEMYEEISKQVPDVPLEIERHGYGHNFSCTEAGSAWVASHVAGLITIKLSSLSKLFTKS